MAAVPPPCCRPQGRALLLVNEHSRTGRECLGPATTALQAVGLEVDHRKGTSREDVARLIREACGDVDRVVIGGGDGTLNAAAPALIETGLPLGILPLGTANDLARTLGLPLGLGAAVGIIAAGRVRPIDLGEVNGIPYFNVASLGLGVDLTRALTRDAKRRWGPLGYAIAGLRVLNRLRAFHVLIDIEGRVIESRTVHLAVGNGRHYGGGMVVSEQASIDDGHLDVYSLEVENVWRLLRLLPALRSGRTRDWTEIRTLEGQEIRITTRRVRSVNADGEIVTKTPARFRLLHGAVTVYVAGEDQE